MNATREKTNDIFQKDQTSVRQFFKGYSDAQIEDRLITMGSSDDDREVALMVKLHRSWYGEDPFGDNWQAD